MQLVTISGPPSSGKTSVLLRLLSCFQEKKAAVAVVKFDCLYTEDDKTFRRQGIPVIKGLSGELCPDHYFIANIEEAYLQASSEGFQWLFSESAGLCNRCSPHIQDIPAICVVDQMSGVYTPKKIGPMLKFADCIVITKSDHVSQAEREVFSLNVYKENKHAKIIHVNGLTGEGVHALYDFLMTCYNPITLENKRLRFPMPMATCSYCLGEKRIGKSYQQGNCKKLRESYQDEINESSTGPIWNEDSTSIQNQESILEKDIDFYEKRALKTLTILAGTDKNRQRENFDCLNIEAGQVIALVGPTGSGKSRLLEDVSSGSDGNGVTGRTILFDGEILKRTAVGDERKLVSHLSQNMHFVMDLSVKEFILFHITSFKQQGMGDEIRNAEKVYFQVLEMANQLAGEMIKENDSLAQLSGGQTRALMIADCAIVSPAPIMLIDEIENAGIQKHKAIKLLGGKDKIVLLSTHDPVLALMADYRFVIGNGSIQQVIQRSEEEKEALKKLLIIDQNMRDLTENLRLGKQVSISDTSFL